MLSQTMHSSGKRRRPGAFTLIELLIVVAIIAILAAIAVPNFLEAQTRAKVTRAKADMRALDTALTSYCVDHNGYPGMRYFAIQNCFELTTPVAYISNVDMKDAFAPDASGHRGDPGTMGGDAFRASYIYVVYDKTGYMYPNFIRKGVVISSWGPDRKHDWSEHYPYYYAHPTQSATWGWSVPAPVYLSMTYDPTNGTKSAGDLGRAVGGFECPPQIGG